MQLRSATRAEKIEDWAIAWFGGAFSVAWFALLGWWLYRTFLQ